MMHDDDDDNDDNDDNDDDDDDDDGDEGMTRECFFCRMFFSRKENQCEG